MPVRLILFAAFAGAVAITSPAFAAEENQEARFLTNTRQLIYDGKRSGEGYFSPDDALMVFQSEREAENPFYQIYLLDFATGDTRRLSPGMGKTTCGFIRPGNKEVLFASTHLDPKSLEHQKAELDFRASGKERRYSWDYDATMDIFSTSIEGGAPKQLTTSPGYDAEGAYSPDGKQIVFCSLRDAYPLENLSKEDRRRYEMDPAWFGEIYIMDADGSNQRRLTNAPGYDGGPFFSPDGTRIVWRRFDKSGMHADVYTMKTDGTDTKRVTAFQAMSWAPYYHPSQKYIIFTSNKLGFTNFELYIVDADGTREPVRITTTDGFDGLPVFTNDGKRLAWASNRTSDNKSQIFIADWNHEAALGALEAAPLRATPSKSK